jgi:hypothetical protein
MRILCILSALLLAPVLPVWAADSAVVAAAEAIKPATREHPLVRALLDRDQAEAVRLIRSGLALDLFIERNLLDDQLPSRSRMISYGEGLLPGYPLAIAAAALGLPGVLEAIGEREPARLHVTDSDNKTAINYAAQQGYAKSVAVLLRYGLNPLQPPREAWASGTPLSRAVWAGHTSVVKLLLEAIPKTQYASDRVTEQVWNAPQRQERMDVLQTLLEAGVSPNYIAPQGGTALISAVEFGALDFVRLLLKYGATVDDHPYRGFSVLQYAEKRAAHDAPNAKEILKLIRQAPKVDRGWQKSRDTETTEQLWRMIEN